MLACDTHGSESFFVYLNEILMTKDDAREVFQRVEPFTVDARLAPRLAMTNRQRRSGDDGFSRSITPVERDRNLWSPEQRFPFATEDFNLNASEVPARPTLWEVGIDYVDGAIRCSTV